MGKANKVKGEYLDVRESVELLQVLKDVSDMRFHALTAEKGVFYRFSESFPEFFRLIQNIDVMHPLVVNDNPVVAIVSITTEEGFVGDLNSKVINAAFNESKKHDDVRFITVGRKGVSKLEQFGVEHMHVVEDLNDLGDYKIAVDVKNFLVEAVMSGEIGKAIVIHPISKDLSTIRARKVNLLPCGYILKNQVELSNELAKVIYESDVIDLVGYLANIWTSSRFLEILYETSLAAAAAQSQQLESSLDKMKKESEVVKLRYRKAKKADIDSSLREVFSARMMTTKS